MRRLMLLSGLLSSLLVASPGIAAEPDRAAAAQAYGEQRAVVTARPDGLIVCEAEEFQVQAPGWEAQNFGANYYAATFANSFLSRKAFLGAPAQCEKTIATRIVQIPKAGKYLALVRYEAAYRFETQFTLRIEQNSRQVLNRLYGARNNLKIWAFRQKLKKEVGWSWGAVENVVWEGHDVSVNLGPGPATISLIAAKQPEPAAKRNVDLVMLTTDTEQVANRIEKENYLPLDGMLTQSGDVFLRVTNHGSAPLTFQGQRAPSGGNWREHSPYWVHIRNWKAPVIKVEAGKTSEWTEVGGLMDTLADGQWNWQGDQKYTAEFAVLGADGKKQPLAKFTGNGPLLLAADADTRYTRRLRKQEDVVYDLLAYLKQENPAPHGRTPTRTPIYGYTFEAMNEGKHAAAVAEFKILFGLSDTKADSAKGRGYIDVRSVPTPKLEEYCQKLGADAKNIAVVSLGDEIGLPSPGGAAAQEGFIAWLKSQNVKPSDLDPAAGNDWSKVAYSVDPKLKESRPGTYYWSKRYQYHYGIQTIKQRTDILRKHLPNAQIGANFSPHYPEEHMFLGEVFKWVSVFRQDGMTLPWSEDYIWQLSIGTPQMNHINFGLFRAGLRHHPGRDIMYYVMPHAPNNTPRQWRRLFYGAVGNGMTMVNLFEFRPVHVAYTENHVDDPAMYREVLEGFRELGIFEDIVQDGQVREAETALWFSETGDIWVDSHGSFAAGKRALFTAIRHQQVPLDFVVEADALDGTLSKYKVLYLTDAHVSRAASKAITAWVNQGGTLFATAGAGMFDELNQPNQTLRKLMGVEQIGLDAPEAAQVTWIKQDIPFTTPLTTVTLQQATAAEQGSNEGTAAMVPVISVRSRIKTSDGEVTAKFADGGPAIVQRKAGKGQTTYCAFLPGLSYYHPAIPKRPVDRGATDDAMVHFLPTDFDPEVSALIAAPVGSITRPVECSSPLVESTVLQSKQGVAIPLVNWTDMPVKGLQVRVRIKTPTGKVSLASGGKVSVETEGGERVYTLDLEEADALLLR